MCARFWRKLDEASPRDAKHEHALVLEFARGGSRALSAIDIVSRGYWYEQFRRASSIRFAVGAAVFSLCAG